MPLFEPNIYDLPDRFAAIAAVNWQAPYEWLAGEISPSDTLQLAFRTRAIYVGLTGNLAIKNARGETVTFFAVPAGTFINVRADYILAATTASHLVILA